MDLGSAIELQPKNAAEALRALDAVSELLRGAGDPRAAFPDVYEIITRRVASEVARPDGVFCEPAWISRLAGRFCEAYLESLRLSFEGKPQFCEAWDIAHKCSALGATVPVQEAMLGLSAHINYDLALGIYTNIVEHGAADDPRMIARYKRDHDVVNEILHDACYEAIERLIERHRCGLSEVTYRHARSAARWVTMQLLRRWRAQVWDIVEALLAARSEGERKQVVEAMGRRAALIGQLITLPTAVFAASRPALAGFRGALARLSPALAA